MDYVIKYYEKGKKMKDTDLLRLLNEYKAGEIDHNKILEYFHRETYEDLGFAKIDHQREHRKGFPEVVYGSGKTVEQAAAILEKLFLTAHGNVMATRVEEEVFLAIKGKVPNAEYHPLPKMITIKRGENKKEGAICVLSGGTSDLPIAEEAAITAEMMGNRVERIYDVGVAGIHRLFAYKDRIEEARVLVVVAGMEGALPSVVAGLVNQPVIAVPTSIGYGASFGGLAALLAMLNSCASGITVVNIDNGFGAGYAASLINQLM